MKQEEERLRREKLEFERQRSGFDEERDRIGKLGLEVQKRSREIDELCSVSNFNLLVPVLRSMVFE